MRMQIIALLAASMSMPLFGQAGTRIEYGKPAELGNVKTVFVSSPKSPELAEEAKRQLGEILPMLAIAPTEEEGDVTVILNRITDEKADAKKVFTTLHVLRMKRGDTVRLYLDKSSEAEEMPVAVKETIAPFVKLLKTVQPDRFGRTAPEPRASGRRMVHTTAGLHPGLSKREVIAALGPPWDMGSQTQTQTWIYRTSEGDVRLVFRGETLVAVMPPAKK